MSNPANPLSKFRSYSYYHVLAMCDSVETAQQLSKQTDESYWEHPSSFMDNNLGRYSPRPLGCGSYSILVNGATDAQYVITDVKYTTITATSIATGDRNNSIAIEGSVSISEPKGVMFLDRVVNCCTAMSVEAASVTWVLKTFFVGYTHDDNIEQISDVAPMLCTVFDITGSFDETGGSYQLEFVGTTHGFARSPQFSKVNSAVHVKPTTKLVEGLNGLINAINDQMASHFECVKSEVETYSPETAALLVPVKYEIVIDPAYDSYTLSDQLVQAKPGNGGNCDDPPTISVPPNTSIEVGIKNIMMLSNEVKQDAEQGDGKVKWQPLVMATYYDGTECSGKKEPTIIYSVRRVKIPSSINFGDLMSGFSDEQDPEVKQNLLTYDYIYTGKNIDIIEFDMKLSMAIAYVMMSTSTNSYNTPGSMATNKTTVSFQDIEQGVPSRLGQRPRSIPVGFGALVKNPIVRQSNDIHQTSQTNNIVTKYASFEVLDTSMTIMGNPMLLHSIHSNATPDFIKSGKSENPNGVFSDWGIVPSLVKVKVKMPRNNDDLALFTGGFVEDGNNASTDYAVDFWFDGFYYVISVEHNFSDGLFTQKLEMLGLPKTNTIGKMQTGSQQSTSPTSKCYNNVFPCGNKPTSQAGSSPAIIPEPAPNSEVADPNAIDKIKDPVDVPGWDQAPQGVKDVIQKASNDYGVDASTLAIFASIESGFGRDKLSGTGAKGLFQQTGKAWKDHGEGNPMNDQDSANAAARQYKATAKELHGFLGRDPTIAEVFTAYNQGPRGFKEIYNACANGNKNSLLSSDVRENIGRQKGGLTKNTSPCEVLAWMRNKVNTAAGGKNHVPHLWSTQNADPQASKSEKDRKTKDVISAVQDCNGIKEAASLPEKKPDGCYKHPNTEQDTPKPST